MPDDDLGSIVDSLRGMYADTLGKIAKWNRLVPSMQHAKDELDWMAESIHDAPSVVNFATNETLRDSLATSQNTLGSLLSIPEPPRFLEPIVTTSGSSTALSYRQFVDQVPLHHSDNREVINWANLTRVKGEALRNSQNRSKEVHGRLNMLSPGLCELHEQAQRATLTSGAAVASPIEAASIQRSLLVEFKGVLINKCKTGTGTKYARISENLAVESDLTKTAVTRGQGNYDALHDELSEISKSKRLVTGERIRELLAQLEDHIWIITNALDPDKIGVSFMNPA